MSSSALPSWYKARQDVAPAGPAPLSNCVRGLQEVRSARDEPTDPILAVRDPVYFAGSDQPASLLDGACADGTAPELGTVKKVDGDGGWSASGRGQVGR